MDDCKKRSIVNVLSTLPLILPSKGTLLLGKQFYYLLQKYNTSKNNINLKTIIDIKSIDFSTDYYRDSLASQRQQQIVLNGKKS